MAIIVFLGMLEVVLAADWGGGGRMAHQIVSQENEIQH